MRESQIICFKADTMIETSEGPMPIPDVTVGMHILSYNHNLQRVENAIVMRTAKSFHETFAKIVFENSINLELTLDHPLYVFKKGWCSISPDITYRNTKILVSELCVGDKCLSFSSDGLFKNAISKIDILNCFEYFYCIGTSKNSNFFANTIVAHDEHLSSLNLQPTTVEYTDATPHSY